MTEKATGPGSGTGPEARADRLWPGLKERAENLRGLAQTLAEVPHELREAAARATSRTPAAGAVRRRRRLRRRRVRVVAWALVIIAASVAAGLVVAIGSGGGPF